MLQAFALVGELAFVDQQAGRHLAVVHRLLNLVERHHLHFDVGRVKLQREVRGRQQPGHRDVTLSSVRGPSALATTTGPYLSPMLAPWLSRRYLSVRWA